MHINKTCLSARRGVFLGVFLSALAGTTALRADDTPGGSSTQPATAPAPFSGLSAVPPPLPTDHSYVVDNSDTNYNPSKIPVRPAPLIELGNPFFGTGNIDKGVELPTGAVWAPTFIVFGTYQSVFQSFTNSAEELKNPKDPRSEWANRLDLYGNLTLTATERLVIGIRPFDDGQFAKPQLARYSGWNFTPTDGQEGFVDKFNGRITTLFFEGDIGQIFPNFDPYNTKQLDIGFSIGRQPFRYQDGMFIDCDLDAVGVTRNTFLPKGGSNLQITAIYAWSQIRRNDGIDHRDPGLIGLFINADFPKTTWNLDTAYVLGDGNHGDGAYAALSATQQIGPINTTFRVLGSKALERDAPTGNYAPLSADGNGSTAVGSGALLDAELSYTVPYSKNLIYLDAYWGINRYTSAARGPDRGGVLGRVGILFAEQPIGRYGSALSSDPERSFGAALGYQIFLDPSQRRQLVLEIGGRAATDGSPTDAAAAGARYQQAFGQHMVLQLDAFAALNDAKEVGYGGRVEFRFEF